MSAAVVGIDPLQLVGAHVRVELLGGGELTGVVAAWYCLIPYGVFRRVYIPRLAVRRSEIVQLSAAECADARRENALVLADLSAAFSVRRRPEPRCPPRVCDRCGRPVLTVDHELCAPCAGTRRRRRDSTDMAPYAERIHDQPDPEECRELERRC